VRATDPVATVVLPTAAVALALAAALLAAGSLGGCKEQAPARPAFDCERLQRRAESCQTEILAAVRRRVEARQAAGELNAAQGREAFLRRKARVQRALRRDGVRKRCRRARRFRRARSARRRLTGLRFCYGRATCRALGQCLVRRGAF